MWVLVPVTSACDFVWQRNFANLIASTILGWGDYPQLYRGTLHGITGVLEEGMLVFVVQTN